MRPAATIALALLPLSAAAAASPANEGMSPERLFPGAVFSAAVPTQEAVLGFKPGARPMRHDELMRYVAAVAAATPRVKVLPYAKSWEGRDLVVVVVADEATAGGLDAFRDEHAKLLDPRGRSADADRQGASKAKAVAWMAYGIHGDELSSTDAAAAVLYRLAAGEDDWAKAARRELVVLIDPCQNPDGRERFLAELRAFGHLTPSSDREDLSHTGLWPWGRWNHYLFDMNRDWINLVQPESRRVAAIATWLPQLMVDSHEMGSSDTYLFSPARPPFNPFLPKRYLDWAGRYASDQAKALDARGYPYYRGEWADEFFVGYGSSWAMYHGAVGILYEMSGTDGTLVRKPFGEVRTYAQAVEHHATSSIANLGTLAANREEALMAMIGSRREAIARGAKGPVRAWILPRTGDVDRTDALAQLLRDQGVEVLQARSETKAPGLHDAATGETAAVVLPAGSYMVPADQPAGSLARVVLDPHVPMEASFLQEERRSLETGKGTRIYDTTSWSLPLEYGVPAYWSAAAPAGDWTKDRVRPPRRTGIVPPAEAGAVPLAWVWDGGSDAAILAVADLLADGVLVRVAEKPFRVGGRAYAPGTLLVRREGSPPDVEARLEAAASRRGVAVDAVTTVLAEQGADLGGNYFHPLVPPRIGVFTGPMIASTEYGAIWHLLDTVVQQRFTAVDLMSFAGADLRRFNVLVVSPLGTSKEAVRALIGKNGMERLKDWVSAGGTLIGIGSGALMLADKDAGLTAARARSQVLDSAPPPVWSVSASAALDAAPLRATGLASSDLEPPPRPAADASKAAAPAAGKTPAPAKSRSAYDVRPVIGPGAAPFVEGVDLGTPLAGKPVEMDAWLKTALPPGRTEPKEDDRRRADDRLRAFSPQGAMLRVDLDPDLYLTWGMPGDLTAWIGADDALIAGPPARVAAAFSGIDTIHRGGLLWPEAAARLAKTAYAMRESVGQGQIVLFLDDPVYRGWMLGTRRLFLNALLYGPGVGAEPPAAW
jgi:hypothetical protein